MHIGAVAIVDGDLDPAAYRQVDRGQARAASALPPEGGAGAVQPRAPDLGARLEVRSRQARVHARGGEAGRARRALRGGGRGLHRDARSREAAVGALRPARPRGRAQRAGVEGAPCDGRWRRRQRAGHHSVRSRTHPGAGRGERFTSGDESGRSAAAARRVVGVHQRHRRRLVARLAGPARSRTHLHHRAGAGDAAGAQRDRSRSRPAAAAIAMEPSRLATAQAGGDRVLVRRGARDPQRTGRHGQRRGAGRAGRRRGALLPSARRRRRRPLDAGHGAGERALGRRQQRAGQPGLAATGQRSARHRRSGAPPARDPRHHPHPQGGQGRRGPASDGDAVGQRAGADPGRVRRDGGAAAGARVQHGVHQRAGAADPAVRARTPRDRLLSVGAGGLSDGSRLRDLQLRPTPVHRSHRRRGGLSGRRVDAAIGRGGALRAAGGGRRRGHRRGRHRASRRSGGGAATEGGAAPGQEPPTEHDEEERNARVESSQADRRVPAPARGVPEAGVRQHLQRALRAAGSAARADVAPARGRAGGARRDEAAPRRVDARGRDRQRAVP